MVTGPKVLLPISVALLAGIMTLFFFGAPAIGAGSLPTGFVQTRVVSGLESPTTMAFAPDGRLFVAEQGGTLRVVKNDQMLATPFLDVSGSIDRSGERGLLGVAFDPDFATNGYVYVYYTRKATGSDPAHNRVVRFTASGDEAVVGSEKLVLRLNNLSSNVNHNGGAMRFGKDGKLYIAVGENADRAAAQSFTSFKGKMLRINKDGTIPTDNPYYGASSVVGKNKAIWTRGLRNPYTFDINPSTGLTYINDVGNATWEEINQGVPKANFGWPVYEGPENDPKYSPPRFAYKHGFTATTGCAITGGAFYVPPASAQFAFPAAYQGDYFFADFCMGWIRRLDPATKQVVPFKGTSEERPVDLKVDSDGDLYFLSRARAADGSTSNGTVQRISYSG